MIGSNAGKFIKDQLEHPAAKYFAMDVLKYAVMSGGNPKIAGPMLAASAAQKAIHIMDRTSHNLERSP